MKKPIPVFPLSATGFFFWSMAGFLLAEDATPRGVVELEELRVVATPIIEGIVVDRYAAPKTVVSREQIEDLNAQDISTALRRTPGVNISRFNPVGAFGGAEGGGIFLRGIGSSRPGAEIKTFIDGVPMFMGIWNHPLLDLLPIDPAASVEVFKSPQPHLFGNAFGAVNIVPQRRILPGYETKVSTAAGSYSTFVGQAETSGKQGSVDYNLGGGYRRSDGHRDHADGRTGNFFGRIGYRIDENWDVSFFGLHTDNSANDPGVKGADPAGRLGTYDTRASLFSATVSHQHAFAQGRIQVYHNKGRGDWLNQPDSEDPTVRENLYNRFRFQGLKTTEAVEPWEGGEILTGFDWEKTEGDFDRRFSNGTEDPWDGHDFTLFSPYAAVSHRFGDDPATGPRLTPSAGARFYHHSFFESKWAPHAGLVLEKGDFSWHAGYARGVVYPGLEVVAFSENVIPALGSSWKNLSPETVDHYQAGVSRRFGQAAFLDLTWFYNDGKNRYVVVPPPPPPPSYQNVGSFVTQGVEAALRIHPTNNLSLFFGSTFMRSDPSDLPYAPKTTLVGGANWRLPAGFSLHLDAQYLDKMHTAPRRRSAAAGAPAQVDGFFLLNGKISHAFSWQPLDLAGSVFLAVENLTDTRYEYSPGYPMPGINAMAGVSLRF